MTSRGHRAVPTAVAFFAVAVGVISLVPVGYLFVAGTSFHDIVEQLRYHATLAAVWETVELTFVISAFTLVLGVGSALLVVRSSLPFPRLFTVLFALPLAVPGFVSAYADYSIELTYAPDLGLSTSFWGASAIMALTLYPYVFLPSVVALRNVDPALEEIVTSLRPRRVTVLSRVILPALRPAMAAGVLIVALHALAEYGAMVQLGRSTLTTKIMAEMLDYGDYRSARSLSLLLTALSATVLLLTRLLTGPSHRHDVSRGASRRASRGSLGVFRAPITLFGLAVPAAAVGPTVVMTVRGLVSDSHGVAVSWPDVGGAFLTTLGYAVAAALVATIAGFPVSLWVNRRRSLAAISTERAVWVAHAIPSAILALSLVYLATRLVPSLYKTPVVLVAAYVILFLPLAVANQHVGLEATRRTYEDVAASLGARPARTFLRVNLPLALPGFVAGALLVGLDASKELTTTLMLIPYNSHTLSTQLWATTNGESLDFTAAAPYAALLVVLGVPPVYLLVRHALRSIEPTVGRARARRARSPQSQPQAETLAA